MKTFYFYDLETSGLNSREDRIMQFAGQRTDMDLSPIGEPDNILIKMSDDTLPSPDAIMVTKITPQKTLEEGITEAEFAKKISEDIFTQDTIAVGFNNVRFDDEFMRHLFWRTFRDPYEWQWKDGRSRWDILDLVRFTRALRPEGIIWPFDDKGEPTNRLELITKLNGIEHAHAHDALSDVHATIAVAKLIKEKQPDLFNYLLNLRDKKLVKRLVNLDNPQPFVYASGRYSNDFNKTTVAYPLAPGRNGNILVFDLRYDVNSEPKYPVVKEFCYNKCPAVAPLGVLEKADGWQKIKLDKETVKKNLNVLLQNPDFALKMREEAENRPEFPPAVDPESALYDGFLNERDRIFCDAVRNATKNQLADFVPDFSDERLPELLIHYKARNFPEFMTESEQEHWKIYRESRLKRQAKSFLEGLERNAQKDPFIAEELNLYFQSLFDANY